VVPPSAAPLRSDGETQGTLAGAASSQGGASSAAAPPPAADSSVPLETTAPSPTSVASAGKSAPGGHAWSVQLGSFASHPNAEKLLRQLKAQGFSAYVLSGGSGSSLRYRVRIGPMADRGAAAQTVAKLKTFGHAASVVPPGG
jgi:DedD protein